MNQDDVVNYPTEFLNSLELFSLPPHNLKLKVGSVIIMLRNINQPRLCKGTRLAVKKMMNNVIEKIQRRGCQSLEVCGTNLKFPCFAHGQLYVACSRLGKPSSWFIYAPQNKTKNMVYQKALN
ncbi:hypothetical protein GWI33_022692 [Rhynchophorus ferrugineus]|uniref:DNA helicase Pif1-like 2B domain-containing protein n=1 Tax=Rhynchophorus ferrugineus TaxID=354439 RepID=A0A834IPL3_RHYFE|nr:hypothetical protein GWI33_022692 [Rhynchophorus ferrugineus]